MQHLLRNRSIPLAGVFMMLALVALAATSVRAGEIRDLFPEEEMRDPKTLDLKIISREDVATELDPSRHVTRIELEYTSFEWNGEAWRHKAIALLPLQPSPKYRGAGVIVSSPREENAAKVRYAEAAVLMGIPTLMIAGNNPGRHYGQANEGNLMGYGSQRFRETGDPHWIGYAWLGKVIVRAVTAAKQIPGFDADRFVVTGCSKRGAAAWIAAGADDRIIGAYATCWNAGNFESWLELKAARWGLDYQPKAGQKTMAPAFITTREQIENAQHPHSREERNFTDPFRFQDRLANKFVLFSAGSNDPLFPVASDSVFVPHMSKGIRIQIVPNHGHNSDNEQQLKAWRMWLAHCFAGRDVPEIATSAERADGQTVVTADVRSRTEIESVRCWSASDGQGAYLNADWKATEMQSLGEGRYRAVLPKTSDPFVGYFIEVDDQDAETVPGVTTSGFQELKIDG